MAVEDDPFSGGITAGAPFIGGRTRFTNYDIPLTTTIITKVGANPATTKEYTGYKPERSIVHDRTNRSWTLLEESSVDQRTRTFLNKTQDLGGPFYLKKVGITKVPTLETYSGKSGVVTESFSGYRWPCSEAYNASRADWDSAFSQVDTSHLWSELVMWGGEGINRTLPTVPESSCFRTLVELARDFPKLPLLAFKKAPTLGQAAGEYLNYTFGIAPTVSDLTSVGKATVDAKKILAQFENDNNSVIRRKVVLHEESSTRTLKTHNAYAHPIGYAWIDPRAKKSPCVHTETVDEKVWFSGAYRYRLPDEGTMRKLAEFNRLYGVVPDGGDFWNLIPWSWLADWFGNFGSFVENISTLTRNDLQIVRAYVMSEKTITTRYTHGDLETVHTTVVKSRQRASPFGFGFRPWDLSFKQKAILTALGTSRWVT